MKKHQAGQQILIDVLISLLKALIFLKKLLVAFFVWVIFKPLRFIFGGLLFKPLVKLYGAYILIAKKIREANQRYQTRFYVIKKFLGPIFLGIIALIVVANNFIDKPNWGEMTDKMHKAPIAPLFQNEFGDYVPEELITESAPETLTCQTVPEKYLSTAAIIKTEPKITTNTAPVDNTQEDCLARGDNLLKPGGILTEQTPVERVGITEYTVKSGDSVGSIAKEFGISVNTILWANNLTARSYIREGDKLKILPISGVLHKVASGDNVKKLADKYDVTADKIILANKLNTDGKLVIGQEIIIPDGKKLANAVAATNSASKNYRVLSVIKDLVKPDSAAPTAGKMQWPTVGYRITQYYSWRHTGLDVANKTGTPLYAAEGGTVEYSGWSNGYGYNVLINHGGGKKTRYAHASKLYVSKGDVVGKGEAIAAMGSTGRSTGPHIHFEVIINGKRVNPLNYIK